MFDAMGLDWEYEPEGFCFEGGLKYLPDFAIRKGGAVAAYVEIKGDLPTRFEVEKTIRLAEGAKVPVYTMSGLPKIVRGGRGLFLQFKGGLAVGVSTDLDNLNGVKHRWSRVIAHNFEYLSDHLVNEGFPVPADRRELLRYAVAYYSSYSDMHRPCGHMILEMGEFTDDLPCFLSFMEGIDETILINAVRAAYAARFEFGGR
jgi:hypothetical protein